jgi:DNA-binding NarL/FixJ family response regulator
MPHSVIVADPDPRAAAHLAAALLGSPFTCVATATHGKALRDALASHNPLVVAADLALPDHPLALGLGWVATAAVVRDLAPDTHVLVTYAPEQAGLVPASLAGGARAYAEKPYLREEILDALHRLTAGRDPLPFFARARRIARALACRFRQSVPGAPVCSAVTRNVSETGLGIATPENLPLRSLVQVEVQLPDRAVVRARAQVVRVVRSDPGYGYEYGLALFDLDGVNRGALRAYIQKTLEAGLK